MKTKKMHEMDNILEHLTASARKKIIKELKGTKYEIQKIHVQIQLTEK